MPHEALALDPALEMNQYAHTAWKVREGFSKGTIQAIAQTSDGYLWLGTEFGLSRFDGVRNVPWQPPSGQQLPSGMVVKLFTSRDGTLWIGTDRGLASWKNGRLRQFAELAGQMIFTIVEDHEGAVWFGTVTLPPAGSAYSGMTDSAVPARTAAWGEAWSRYMSTGAPSGLARR